MRKFIIAIISATVIGCVSATADEPSICKSSTMTFDPMVKIPIPNVSVPMVESSTLMDMSGTIGKLTDVGTVNTQITDNILKSVNGDLSWVSQILVMIESSSNNSKYPQVKLADYILTSSDQSSGSVNVPTLLDANTLVSYLNQGEVKLTFGIAGTLPQQSVDLTNEVCLHASLQVTKSL